MKQGKDALRAEWLANEAPNNSLGVYGEFPSTSSEHQDTSSETSRVVVSKQVTTSSQHQREWVPDESNPPENVEVEQASTPATTETTSKSSLGIGAKIGLGILSALALAFGIKNLNLPN